MHPEIKEITAKMKVLKFGGTSVGSPENMRAVMDLVTDGEQKIVVLSAMSGTTNALVEISNYLHKKNKDTARIFIGKLEDKYKKVVSELYFSDKNKRQGARVIKDCFDTIKSFTSGTFNEVGENTILAQGEIISTNLVALLMNENGFQTNYITGSLTYFLEWHLRPFFMPSYRRHLNKNLEKHNQWQEKHRKSMEDHWRISPFSF